MREVLSETEAQVIEGGHQRITAVYDYIYPRYNASTADGVVLDVDWWLRIAEDQWGGIKIDRKNLMQAMSKRAKKDDTSVTILRPENGPSQSQAEHVRSAKSAIKNHPELVDELLKDPEVHRTLQNAVDSQRSTPSPVSSTHNESRQRDWSDVIRRAAGMVDDALKAEEVGNWQPTSMDVWYLRCVATLLNRRFLPSADDLVSDIEKFLEVEANR